MTRHAILIFDVETTGLRREHDQIIELAVQWGIGPQAARRDWRFCPSVPIDPTSERIHGISVRALAREPPFAARAARLHRLFSRADVLIGYNVAFDLDMLQAEFVRARLPPLALETKQIIDPYRLWQKMEPRGLRQAHRRFAGRDFDGAHRAGADVAATASVLVGMLAAFGLAAEWTALAELCCGEVVMTTDPRQERGRLLAQKQDGRIRHVEGAMWFVPSDTTGGYLVNVATASCSCPDYQQHPTKCKHQWAVELVRSRGSDRTKPKSALATLEPAKVAPVKLGRMADFTQQEQENIRKALRFLHTRCGGWAPLGRAIRLGTGTIKPMASTHKVSARLALRLARFAGVPIEDLIAGRYPPAGTCAHCGYRPGTRGAGGMAE